MSKKPSESPNDLTLEAYDKNVSAYKDATPQSYTSNHGPLLRFIENCLKLIPKEAKILEIGSGIPREARYMRSKGFEVTTSDASQGLAESLRSQGEPALLFNILKDEIPDLYDLIFANAVVQHFTVDDLKLALRKVFMALPPGGILAFSAKQGKGEVWIHEKFQTKRYVHYWRADDLRRLTEDVGFKVVFIENGTVGDIPTHIWINIIARKPSKAQATKRFG